MARDRIPRRFFTNAALVNPVKEPAIAATVDAPANRANLAPASALAFVEPCCDTLCCARQQAHIASCCREVKSHVEEQIDIIGVPRQSPR
jgi:hypothetical protein